MTASLSAILFDMDGVITDTMPRHCRTWQKVFAQQGLKVSREEIYSREGQQGLVSVLEIFAKNERTLSLAKAKTILKTKEQLFKRRSRTAFIPGARLLLKSLQSSGLRLALVTGTSRKELLQILPLSIQARFAVIVCGDDVKKGKPDPEPYLRALKMLGVSARQALVVENAPFGIASAKSAGLFCAALSSSLAPKYLKQADVIVNTHTELKRILYARFKMPC